MKTFSYFRVFTHSHIPIWWDGKITFFNDNAHNIFRRKWQFYKMTEARLILMIKAAILVQTEFAYQAN